MNTKDFDDLKIGTLGNFTEDSMLLVRKIKDPSSPLGFGRLSFKQLNEYIDFDPTQYDLIVSTVQSIEQLTNNCQSLANYMHLASCKFINIFTTLTAHSGTLNIITNNVINLSSIVQFIDNYANIMVLNRAALVEVSARIDTANTLISSLTTLSDNTPIWNNVYTTVNANSANWNNVYTTVNANSTTW